jgi:hypothetical protein
MGKRRVGISEGGKSELSNVKEIFEPHWSSIEQAYGHLLDGTIREKILSAVKRFIDDARIEQNAPLQKDAEDWLVGLRQISLKFKDVLTKTGALSDSGRRLVGVLLQQELKSLYPQAAGLSTCRTIASKLAEACARTLAKVKNKGFYEGDAWRVLIKDLTNTLGKAGLPTGAPHSRDKKSGDSVAPFVALVIAIQKVLPSEMRRHHRADPLSLGREINRARKSMRDKLPRARASKPSPTARAGHKAPENGMVKSPPK